MEKKKMTKFENMGRVGRAAASGLLMLLLAACSVEPTYNRPDAPTPAAFKEAPVTTTTDAAATPLPASEAGTWKTAEPAEDAHRGEWWIVFNDSTLNDLEKQAADANQDLNAPTGSRRWMQASVRRANACRRLRSFCRTTRMCRRRRCGAHRPRLRMKSICLAA
jgi:multidrug efflux system outer membrane protein